MKNGKGRKTVETLAVILVTAVVLAGCGQKSAKEEDKLLSDNVLITETGEVIENPEKTDEKNSEIGIGHSFGRTADQFAVIRASDQSCRESKI